MMSSTAFAGVHVLSRHEEFILLSLQGRPMIDQSHPFQGLNTRILLIIPIKGRGFINQGSGFFPSMERRPLLYIEVCTLNPKA